MEELKKEGLTRSIGVSNYREEDLLEMESNWEIAPAVNQVSLPLFYSLKMKLMIRSRCIPTSFMRQTFSDY